MATKIIAWNTGSGNITLTYDGQGNGRILVQSDDNDLSVARSQQITIETTNGSPVVTITVTISQEAKSFTPVITDYTYTGSKQTVTLQPGTYKMECWGAQGGSIDGASGGKGGYAVGTIIIREATTAYIYVGGQGAYASGTGAKAGGFNGGGNSYGTTTNYYGGSGGGGSDIRLGADSLSARVIVAGGGGGAGRYNSSNKLQGGYGGGATGGTGGQSSDTDAKPGQGGTQSRGGYSYYATNLNSTTYGTLAGLGVGGGAKSGVSNYRTVGGGGGYYGGGYSQRAGAGGGSGYVGNLSDAQNKAGNTSFPSTSGGTETGHSGNGHIRITQIA